MTNPLTPRVLAELESDARKSLVLHLPQELALPLIAAAMRAYEAGGRVASERAAAEKARADALEEAAQAIEDSDCVLAQDIRDLVRAPA